MVQDKKLIREEARRMTQHEDVKAKLRSEVNRAVAAEGRADLAEERAAVAAVGRELEQRAVQEVAESEREVQRHRGAARAAQVIDYVFFVIYTLIAIAIVLELAGANEGNWFKNAIDTVTAPFLMPFRGLFSDPAIGQYRFMFSYMAALVVWILVHLGIRGLLRLVGRRKTTM
jgi:uncharacterized protein YggT (Ycf19 family)